MNGLSSGFYEALDLIRNKWRYPGLFTFEPEGNRDSSLFDSFVKAMRSLRNKSDRCYWKKASQFSELKFLPQVIKTEEEDLMTSLDEKRRQSLS